MQPKSISPDRLRGQGPERYRQEFKEVNFSTYVRIDPDDLDFRFFDESETLHSRGGSKHCTYRNGGIRRDQMSEGWERSDIRPPFLFTDAGLTSLKQRLPLNICLIVLDV